MINFFTKVKISTKIIIVSTILAFIFLGAVPFYVSIRAQTIFSDKLISAEKEDVEVTSRELEVIIKDIQTDVLSISSTPPVLGLYRASLNDGFDDIGGSSEKQWKDRLAIIFSAFEKSKNYYSQLRFIDISGQEIVRVDFNKDSGIKIVPDEDLQNKANRYYFLEAAQLDEGEVFISEPSLNREGSPPEIQIPYDPVIHVGTPVFNNDGEIFGLIYANVAFEEVLKLVGINSGSLDESYIISSNGDYVFHKDGTKLWGGVNDLNSGEGLTFDFPNLSAQILSENQNILETDDNFIFFKRINLSLEQEGTYLVLIRLIEKRLVFEPFVQLFLQSSLIGIAVFITLFFVFRYFINRLLRPLKDLTDLAKEIGRGNFDHRVKVKTNDEIGQLSQVFNATSEQLKILYSDLDSLVKQKTKEAIVAKKRLEIATSSANIGIWDWDVKSNNLQWNTEMYELYGIAKDQFSNAYEAWSSSVHPDDLNRAERELQAAVKGIKQFDTDFRIILPNGTIKYIRAYGVGLKNKKGEIARMLGVNWDITPEKEIEKAKDEFISLASHQLKTPLASVRWLTDILLAGDAGRLTKKQKEFISDIRETNHRMNDLVKMLLNVSRIELETFAIRPEPTDLKKLAASVIKDLQPLIHDKKVKITKRFQSGLPKIKVDPNFMRMIFQNLISNAIKYNVDGGKVEVGGIKDGNQILIKVSDTGLGIPKNQQDEIFTKLFRANNVLNKNIEGNGLGLYIIKTVIEEVKGKIWFESEQGKGTTFYVSIPASGMKKKKGNKSLG